MDDKEEDARRRFLEAQRGPAPSDTSLKRKVENALIKAILKGGVLDE